MDQISGNTASCSSISSAYFCSVKCTVDTLCCGSICGNLEQKMHFDSSFTPQKESSCVHYSSDSSHGLSGKKRCTYFDYNAYGSVSDCRSTFRSQSCKSCTMCGSNIPGTQIPMATTDCSNIDGGDVLSYECSDVDEMEEMMDLALSCANPSKPDSSSGASVGAIVGGVIGGIVAIALIAGLILFHCRRQGTVSTSTPHLPPIKQSEPIPSADAPVAMVQPITPQPAVVPPMGANDV